MSKAKIAGQDRFRKAAGPALFSNGGVNGSRLAGRRPGRFRLGRYPTARKKAECQQKGAAYREPTDGSTNAHYELRDVAKYNYVAK